MNCLVNLEVSWEFLITLNRVYDDRCVLVLRDRRHLQIWPYILQASCLTQIVQDVTLVFIIHF